MPAAVRDALKKRGLMPAHEERPAYERQRLPRLDRRGQARETKAKRLAQMLDELERGGIHMKTAWRG